MEEITSQKNNKKNSIIPLIISILIVLFAFYLKASLSSALDAAGSTAYSGAYDLSTIKSVGGNSIAEAFYQGMGEYYKGQYRLLKALGNGIGNLILIISLVGFVNSLFLYLSSKNNNQE